MFAKLKNWMTGRNPELEARLVALEASTRNAEHTNRLLQTQLERTEEELSVFKDEKAADQARRDGTEPWVEIRSAKHDPNKGILIELDWNDAFIAHLRQSGIKGKTDNEIVQKWIAFLYQDLIERLEAQVVTDRSEDRVSDYA